MSAGLNAALRRLSSVHGVLGAVLVDGEAGVPVLAEVSEGVDSLALSALAASAFTRTARSVAAAGFGAVGLLQLEAEHGHVLASGRGDLIVVVLVERGAQLGLVRLEVERVLETSP